MCVCARARACGPVSPPARPRPLTPRPWCVVGASQSLLSPERLVASGQRQGSEVRKLARPGANSLQQERSLFVSKGLALPGPRPPGSSSRAGVLASRAGSSRGPEPSSITRANNTMRDIVLCEEGYREKFGVWSVECGVIPCAIHFEYLSQRQHKFFRKGVWRIIRKRFAQIINKKE